MIKIIGTHETLRLMSMYNLEIRDSYKNLVHKTGKNVAKVSKSKAPKYKGSYNAKESRRSKPGDTKRSIKMKKYEGGLYARVKPRKPPGWKAHFHELGTKKGIKAKKFMETGEQSEINNFNSEARRIANKERKI